MKAALPAWRRPGFVRFVHRLFSLLVLLLLFLAPARARADELSGADKLRLVYSNQFSWTRDGLPIVTVRVLDHRGAAIVSGAGMRVLPDGEGGSEIASGDKFSVRIKGGGPGKIRWHVVTATFAPSQTSALSAELARWRAQRLSPRTFEVGALFAVKGQVLDSRRVLVAPKSEEDETRARRLAAEMKGTVYPELVERPRGVIEAVDERGTVVRNDGIVWFAPGPSGLLELCGESCDEKTARRYFGRLYATVDITGKLAVVNAVPEDRLLAGLVPAEMPANSPPEALKAQAVAARNELLAKLGARHLTDPFRLCNSEHCQVYAGQGREDPRTTAAITATRGQFLVRDDGSLVDAVYSSSCGGHTEDNEAVWGGAPDPALRGRPDSFCGNHSWQAAISLDALGAGAGVGRLREVAVVERGVSGRATRLRVTGDGGETEIKGELAIRRALGNLKSSKIELRADKDSTGHLTALSATGSGHGHGVGMCQQGAVGMARAALVPGEILARYYPGTRLRKLY